MGITLSNLIDEIENEFYYLAIHENDRRINGAFKYNAKEVLKEYLDYEVIDINPSEKSSIASVYIKKGEGPKNGRRRSTSKKDN